MSHGRPAAGRGTGRTASPESPGGCSRHAARRASTRDPRRDYRHRRHCPTHAPVDDPQPEDGRKRCSGDLARETLAGYRAITLGSLTPHPRRGRGAGYPPHPATRPSPRRPIASLLPVCRPGRPGRHVMQALEEPPHQAVTRLPPSPYNKHPCSARHYKGSRQYAPKNQRIWLTCADAGEPEGRREPAVADAVVVVLSWLAELLDGPQPRRVWTAIRICPVTVTKSTSWPSQRVIGFAGHRAARSAPNADYFRLPR